MRKLYSLILFFLFTIIISDNLNSQVTLTGSTTESRCTSTGTISINASGGSTPYIYKIVAGPQLRPGQLGNVFSNLPAGVYTITVIDNLNDSSSITLTINGNYIPPTISMTGKTETCLGNDGEIYVAVSNGRTPFTYEITSPISVGPQTSDTFKNLSAGNYLVRVTDSCGNFTTQPFNLLAKSYANLKNLETIIDSMTCDSIYVTPYFNATGTNWEDSLDMYVVDYYNTSDTVARGRFPFSVALERHKRFIFYVYDSCGNTDNAPLTSIKAAFRTPTSNCPDSTYNISYLVRYASSTTNVKDISTNISYQLIAGPVTTPIQYNDPLFDSIPAGTNYVAEICDTVCSHCIRDTFNINTNGVSNFFLRPWYACDTGRGRLWIVTGGPNTQLTVVINTAPPTFPYPLPYTLTQFGASQLNVYDCPKGFYSAIVTDSCTFSDTFNVNVNQYDLRFNRNVNFSLACNNTYSITTTGSYRNQEVSSNSYIHLLDSNYNPVDSLPNCFPATSYNTSGVPFSYTFPNVSGAGKYYIRYQFFYSCPNQYILDSVVLPPTNSPLSIDSLIPTICSDSIYGSIEVLASGGLKAYYYEIIAGPVLRGPQLDSIFDSLPQGIYTIRVSDTCGQSSVYGTELVKYGGSNLTPYGGQCYGDSLYVLADTLPGATFQWTGPNSYLSNSRLLKLEPLTINDTGTYYLRVQYGLCVDTTIPYTIYGDTTKPVANCKDDTLYLNSGGAAILNPSLINNGSYDSCGITSMAVFPSLFTCNNIGVNSVIFVVSDSNGNTDTCLANVTVIDTISPIASCQNITIYIDSIGNDTININDIDNGSSDNCGLFSLRLSDSIFSCLNLGLNTVWLIATDSSGNIDSCSANVNVVDTIAPIARCQNITTYLNVSGLATITSNQIDNGSTDNCGIDTIMVTPNTFTCNDTGSNIVTLIVIDSSGNIDSCNATVTVMDTIPPTVICQNLSIYLDSNGMASISVSDINNGSTDNCGLMSLSISDSVFSCSDIGINTIWLIGTDNNGNSDSCSATVNVLDTISPWFLTCNNSIITDTLDGDCSFAVPNLMTGTSYYDNCDSASVYVTQNPLPGSVIQVTPNGQFSNYQVIVTITDSSSNSSSCIYNIQLLCYPELIIPQFISPNGDNLNDTWIITGLNAFESHDIKVFNRFGNIVFQSSNYQNDWNGRCQTNGVLFRSNEDILPHGTYFYLVDVTANGATRNYRNHLFIRP